jgi:hypothetical protein
MECFEAVGISPAEGIPKFPSTDLFPWMLWNEDPDCPPGLDKRTGHEKDKKQNGKRCK